MPWAVFRFSPEVHHWQLPPLFSIHTINTLFEWKKAACVCVRFLWLSCLTSKMDLENIRVNYVQNLFFAVQFVSIDCHHSFNPFISGFFRFVRNSILFAASVVLWFRHIALDQWRICKIAMSRCCWKGETEWNTSHRTKNFTYIPSQNWMKTNTIACFHRVFPFALLDVFLSIYLSFDTQLLIRGHSCLPAMNWIALLRFDVIPSFILIAMC